MLYENAKTSCSGEAAAVFRQCAEVLLMTSELTSSERSALASCNFAHAAPEGSSEDLFEVARASVKAHCVFGY